MDKADSFLCLVPIFLHCYLVYYLIRPTLVVEFLSNPSLIIEIQFLCSKETQDGVISCYWMNDLFSWLNTKW